MKTYEHVCILCGRQWNDENMLGVVCPGCMNSGRSPDLMTIPHSTGVVPSTYEEQVCSLCPLKDAQILQLTRRLEAERTKGESRIQSAVKVEKEACIEDLHAAVESLDREQMSALGMHHVIRALESDLERRIRERRGAAS